MKKFAAILVLSILAVISVTASVAIAIDCNCGDICVNETGWWCDGGAFNPSGTPIQAAIDNASVCCGTFSCVSPCIICVTDGIYTENVDVTTANLVIISENGAASTTVTAADWDDVFHVEADCVTIQGFTVTGELVPGVGNGGYAGIRLGSGVGANYCNILDNHVCGNDFGIILEWSNHNMLSGNTVNDNYRDGIYLASWSNYNTIANNDVSENNNGVALSTVTPNNYNDIINNMVSSNKKYGIYLKNGECYNNIRDNTVMGNERGICLEDAHHNIIKYNEINDNGQGVLVENSWDNTIERNRIERNGLWDTGMHLTGGSYDNEIHENCFIDNVPQAWDDGTDNNWDGNYWSPPPGGPGSYVIPGSTESEDNTPLPECPLDLWQTINTKLDELIDDVNAAAMPNIIRQRLIDKLVYAKELKDNAHEEYEAGNIDAATKKLGVAKSQVESFASMVRITRRISAADKASFLADATEIIGKIDTLIDDIETGA